MQPSQYYTHLKSQNLKTKCFCSAQIKLDYYYLDSFDYFRFCDLVFVLLVSLVIPQYFSYFLVLWFCHCAFLAFHVLRLAFQVSMFMYFLFSFDIPVPSVLLSFPSRYVRFVSPVFPSCFHFPHYPLCVYILCVSLCFSLGCLCFLRHYFRCSFRFLVQLFQIRVFFVYLSALLPYFRLLLIPTSSLCVCILVHIHLTPNHRLWHI